MNTTTTSTTHTTAPTTVTSTAAAPQHAGIPVATALVAGGGLVFNHGEGIVVESGLVAGPGGGGGVWLNHAEGMVR